jgi:hypothetical protein
MLASIADCTCVVAGGIGWGARDQMSALGITPIVTTLTSVEDAARCMCKRRDREHRTVPRGVGERAVVAECFPVALAATVAS